MDQENKELKNYPVWHPFTQMQVAGIPPKIVKATGNYLHLEDGSKLLDAVASWWVNPFGHGRPELAKAIHDQVLQLDHTIFAGFTHDPALDLSNKLVSLLGAPFSKVFFSDNGSTSVEVAIKMAIQAEVQAKPTQNVTIFTLQDGYHGDTFGSMSAGRFNGFFDPFKDFLFQTHCLPNPGEDDFLLKLTEAVKIEGAKVIIVEPLIQGAGGMKMYSPQILNTMFRICKENGVRIIADEVMTGFGRTGKMFAFQWADIRPDFVCLSKCLTGGIMPMGVTLTTQEIFSGFLSDDKSQAFLHGHSYTGNPVGCAAGLASLALFEAADMPSIWGLHQKKHTQWTSLFKDHPNVSRCTSQGVVFAMHLKTAGEGYFSGAGNRVQELAAEKGVLLRPLGNIVYVLPPFSFSEKDLDQVFEALQHVANNWR
ncbi:MAG: adenosylmethionine-8-amino-7-oxononanoate aminotransferase [Sphingobacteriales bacterium]|jgi:adenosylmethionine-8-amino-7-oxononanoate aminotransferase